MIPAKEHKRIIDAIGSKTGYYPYGYNPEFPQSNRVADINYITYCFTGHIQMHIGNYVKYSDTTGIKDYTGMVYCLMLNHRHLRTYTSLDQFLEDSVNIPLYEKKAVESQYLADIKHDFY